ncbi:efflux transporter periplasmic adaptor subunit, partial [Pseudomonas sp. GD03867]|nr:efflux transporter periplasmic adaptor subunit [Pseudomonas sp. GD03867]
TRSVRTGVMHGSRWQIVEGLRAGDQVIVGSPAGLAAGMPVVLAQAQQAAAR